MNTIYLELRKICNRNTVIISLLFLALILFPLFQAARSADVLDDQGNIHSGIGGWRILKERTAPGVMTTEYLLNMKRHYESSVDKPYIEGKVDTDRKLGKKLMFPHDILNWTLNFPYDTYRVMKNDLPLTDAQLTHFYEDWKSSFNGYLANEYNLFPYSQKQIDIISQRLQAVSTPFVFRYDWGWESLKISLLNTLHLFFMFLAFILCESFARNSSKGIDKVTLSTKESRQKLIPYKLRASCLFATVAYLLYLLILLLFHAVVYTLGGWDSSVQLGTLTFYSMNALQEGLIYMAMGYIATLVVTHLILLLSVIVKRGRAVLVVSLLYFYLVHHYQMGRGPLIERMMTFMPQNFVNDLLSIDQLFFVGNLVLPYVYVALLLSAVYMLIIRVGIRLWMRHYYLQ